MDQQIGDLEVGRLFGELLDGIAAVTKDAVFTVELGDRRRGRCRRAEAGIGEPDAGKQFGPWARIDAPVDDRYLDRLASAVIGDGYALGHSPRNSSALPALVRLLVRIVSPGTRPATKETGSLG